MVAISSLTASRMTRSVIDAPWADKLPPQQWAVYDQVIARVQAQGIPFALGGGLAFSHYAGRWRNTKDMDLYVRPQDRQAVIAALMDAGLRDYFEVHDYDRAWIFRSHDGQGTIVDVIWQMANYRAQVDDGWLERGGVLRIHGREVPLLPPEELVWSKLYVMQRERCDWGDLLNILNAKAATLDWRHLIARVGDDRRLLAALVNVFAWVCPGRAQDLPSGVWEVLGVERPAVGTAEAAVDTHHVRLLDSRDWFGPDQPVLRETPTRNGNPS